MFYRWENGLQENILIYIYVRICKFSYICNKNCVINQNFMERFIFTKSNSKYLGRSFKVYPQNQFD